MGFNNLGENVIVTTLAGGTFINGAFGTMVNGAPAGKGLYHTVIFAGTCANHGTINVFAVQGTAGANPIALTSLPVGSGDGNVVIDVRSSAFGTLASSYTHIGAFGTVEAGGTWRGALTILSYHLKSAPPGTAESGILAYGTKLT